MSPYFHIDFRPLGSDGLRAHVTGGETFDNTVSYWEEILDEVQKTHPRHLLLVDELRGPPLLASEWQDLVDRMSGRGLELVRIAHVKPDGLDLVEYCEIFALEAGFEARVFTDERTAELWLHYGGDTGAPPGGGHEAPYEGLATLR